MTTTTIIGMDISKYSFELCGTDERGRHTLHRRLHRDKVSLFFANLPACRIAMESCSGSQHWARQLTALGHQVKLVLVQTLSRADNQWHESGSHSLIASISRPPL